MMSAHTRYVQLLILLPLCLSAGACKSTASKNNPSPNTQRIELKGDDPKNGMFDVSIEYAPDGTGWLAYSRVQIPKFIETHIAKSTDGGRTWTHVTNVGKSHEATINIKGKKIKGVWRDETPCLLYDPTDKPDRRWKLFTNRYFTTDPYKPKNRLMDDGTIDLKYAASPAGPWSAAECIVGRHSNCKIHIQQAHPSLANIKMNTEPGAIIQNGVIYLSMDAGTVASGLGDWNNYRIILLSSKDHGATWSYVGTLLNHKDSMRFGYLVFTGASLARANNKLYILATPSGGLKKSNKGHDGTMVIEITDIAHAEIKRDKTGKPIVVKRLEPPRGSGGLADYDENNTAGGVVFSTQSLFGFPQIFRLHQSGEGIVGPN